MPNWADVEYKCVGDPKEVRSLHKVLKYMDDRKTSIIENDFGKWWLGNLVTGWTATCSQSTIIRHGASSPDSEKTLNGHSRLSRCITVNVSPQTVSVLPMIRPACIFRNLTAWPPLTTNRSFS